MTADHVARPNLPPDLGSCLAGRGIEIGDVLWLQHNPRAVRTLRSLIGAPQTREAVDRVSGSSNGPNVVMRLRRQLQLELPCVAEPVEDRDGRHTCRGVYRLTPGDAELARRLLEGLAHLLAHAPRGDGERACRPEGRDLSQDAGGAR